MTDIISYLNEKGIEYKYDGVEIILKCPNCHKDKLYLNSKTNVYHCFHCEVLEPDSVFASGHFSKLMEYWGDIVSISSPIRDLSKKEEKNPDFTELVERYHHALLNSKKGLKYLFSRGITEESINRFKLGFTRRYNQDWVSIPSYEDGIPKLLKYRKCPPDENTDLGKYIREAGGKTVLFNGDCLKDHKEIFLTEGEGDCISLIQQGYENAVGLTGGASGGAKSFPSEFYDKLNIKEKIYLALDPDMVGQKAAREIWATRLGLDRCYNIVLPENHDLNSYFQEYTKEDFEKLIKQSQVFKIDGIMSLKEALFSFYMNGDIERYSTPWESVNRLLNGGVFKKTLTVVGGGAGVGKTSYTVQWMHYIAKNYNMPCLMFCLEMPEWSLGVKVIQLEKDLTYNEVLPSDALAYAMDLEDIPIYFGYSPKMSMDKIYNTFKEARNRFGVEFFIFDNLQLLVRTGKEHDIGNATGMFKSMAMELNIMMVLVSQPTKMNDDGVIINFDHLKGSSAIGQDADFAILLQRNREKTDGDILNSSFSPITRTIVDKARFASGGTTFLNFIGNKSKFAER